MKLSCGLSVLLVSFVLTGNGVVWLLVWSLDVTEVVLINAS